MSRERMNAVRRLACQRQARRDDARHADQLERKGGGGQ
jgi:hypothetical protein